MTKLVKRILFPTDFSSSSSQAFNAGLAWAEVLGADFEILHVMAAGTGVEIDSTAVQLYISEQEKFSRSKLEQLVFQAKERILPVQSRLLMGVPTDQIAQFAVDYYADLIITGTHGWTGLDRVLMGSVAERMITLAPCPVLTIRHKDGKPQESETQEPPDRSKSLGEKFLPRHLLVPIDFSERSLDAFEYGTQVAKWFDASVTLVHSVEPLPYGLDFTLTHPIENKVLRDKVKSRLTDLTNLLRDQGLTADYQLRDKAAPDSILETVSDIQADLIVMGAHGRRGLSRLIMGSVTTRVVRHSPCPVLTVKSPKFRYGGSPP